MKYNLSSLFVLLTSFFMLLSPVIAWAHALQAWEYHLSGPEGVSGTMTLRQQALLQGTLFSSKTELRQGLAQLEVLHSHILVQEEGNALSYDEQATSKGKELYSLHLQVRGRQITGTINRNGHTEPFHYHIDGPTPRVYLMGNSLLNGVQGLLYSLKGAGKQSKTVLFPAQGTWFRAVLQPEKLQRWNEGSGHSIPVLPVKVAMEQNGHMVTSLQLWCTPKRHLLLAEKQGRVYIRRINFPATVAEPAKLTGNPRLEAFFQGKAAQVTLRHLHLAAVGRKMAGILTLPRQLVVRGSILLIPGSGPTNANGNNPLGLHDDIYKQLAYELAEHGYAMLRYDKPSISPATTTHPPGLTLRRYAEAAAAWFSWLKKQKDLQNTQMIVMGHSAGGVVALYGIDAGLLHPDKLVLLESPGASLGKVLFSQMQYQAKLRGASESDQNAIKQNVNQLVASIKSGNGETLRLPEEFLKRFPLATAFTQSGFLPLFKSEFAAEPQQLMKAVRIPTLIIQGGEDIQVLPWNGNRLHDANPSHTRLAYIPHLSHDLTMASNDQERLDPAPPGRLLDDRMILDIAKFLSTTDKHQVGDHLRGQAG